jgi:hypothetical protein
MASWWVMVPAGTPDEPPDSPDAQIIQTASATDPGTVTLGGKAYVRRAGPYPSKSDAQHAAPVGGLQFIGIVIGAAAGAGAAAASGNGAAAPAAAAAGASTGGAIPSAFGDVASALSAFYDKLTDGKMWRSLGWLLLGVLLITFGLILWLGPGALKASPYGQALGAVQGAG